MPLSFFASEQNSLTYNENKNKFMHGTLFHANKPIFDSFLFEEYNLFPKKLLWKLMH